MKELIIYEKKTIPTNMKNIPKRISGIEMGNMSP
jgi:hypothetical protein